ncbi:MAG: 2-phosphosulfolactate phosphatase [Bacteroidota bacterium]|jgi:2-phosphosulfolactate phosphatase
MEHKIEVCFSPHQYSLFKKEKQVVVVVDILRATSAIVTAFANGVSSMVAVKTPEEAIELGKHGYLLAGERNGEKLEGFMFGNSPISFTDHTIAGKKIVITTTNGTQAIHKAADSEGLAIGAFLNLEAVAEWCNRAAMDVLVLCAGWKDKFNLEDTLFAGALSARLLTGSHWMTQCDSTYAALNLWKNAKNDLYGFLESSSHRHRLQHLQLEDDIRFCLELNRYDIVPVQDSNGKLVQWEIPVDTGRVG